MRRILYSLVFLLTLVHTAHAQPANVPYASIKGIPDPTFGITETAPAEPSSWSGGTTSATAGYYYVCNSCAGATDTSNTYGHPNQPRLTIPTTLAAGSYVRMKGGPYTNSPTITTSGTSGSPVWIRGAPGDRPSIQNEYFFGGSYTIIEHLFFTVANSSATVAGRLFIGGDHMVVRDSESQATGNLNRLGGFFMLGGDHQVWWRNWIHDLGDLGDLGDQDQHCMGVGGDGTANDLTNSWIVYNEMERCSGDGLQINSGNAAGANDSAHHLYIGGNESHGHKQTGMWVKTARDVIFSENTVYDIQPSSSSTGTCSGAQYGPQRVWWIFNHFYDCEHGIQIQSISGIGNGTQAYYIGNLIHDVVDRGLSFWPDTHTERYIIGNTISGATDGIFVEGNVGWAKIENNIIANTTGQQIDVTNAVSVSASTEAHHNLLEGTVSVLWDSTTYTSLASWTAATIYGDDSIAADPLFINVATDDYHIDDASPAQNAGLADPEGVAATYFSLYGVSIAVDYDGVARPNPPALGAFETEGTITVPDAPTIGAVTPGNTQCIVAFTPPAFDGGAAITSYTATSTPGSLTGTGSSSPITVTGLSNGTGYTFTVYATNSQGNSSPSSSSATCTPTVGTPRNTRLRLRGAH